MKSFIISFILQIYIQIAFRLNKIKVIGRENLDSILDGRHSTLLGVWHGRFLFPSYYLYSQNIDFWAIASKHKDAEVMAKILSRWGFGLIRGSSRKGGENVIKEMNKKFKEKQNIAVTCDGPKGPPKIAKPGSVSIAIKNNSKIYTITGSATKYWKINSWDSFMLPKPFGTVYIIISEELETPLKNLSSEDQAHHVTEFLNLYQENADKLAQES